MFRHVHVLTMPCHLIPTLRRDSSGYFNNVFLYLSNMLCFIKICLACLSYIHVLSTQLKDPLNLNLSLFCLPNNTEFITGKHMQPKCRQLHPDVNRGLII